MNSDSLDLLDKCSRANIQLVASLDMVKNRRKLGMFKVEGWKSVIDVIPHFRPVMIFATHECLSRTYGQLTKHCSADSRILKATRADLERMSSLATAPDVIALFKMPEARPIPADFGSTLSIAIDGVQDPGNLGTILRTCDWFGVKNVLCGETTVDVYNSKVIKSTMGAIARLNIYSTHNLADDLVAIRSNGINVYGTFLEGTNIYTSELGNGGVIVVGNEGNGISDGVAEAVTHKLTIPSYPVGELTSESLNVGCATAIIISLFRAVEFK